MDAVHITLSAMSHLREGYYSEDVVAEQSTIIPSTDYEISSKMMPVLGADFGSNTSALLSGTSQMVR